MKKDLPNLIAPVELPLDLNISFSKVMATYEKYTKEEYKDHPYYLAAKKMQDMYDAVPEFAEGFSDFSLIENNRDLVNMLLEPLFPEPLQDNEIKAACIPFSFSAFKYTKRFQKILENAGKDFELQIRNFNEDHLYIHSCAFILSAVYGYHIDLHRPFIFDIPDKKLGTSKHYRVAFNADFSEIIPTDKAKKITEEDYKRLLDSFDNIDLWKELFPPNSYIFKGFGIMNLFDVTVDDTISSVQKNLLKANPNIFEDLQGDLANFYGIKDIKMGFSVFEIGQDCHQDIKLKKAFSLVFDMNRFQGCDSTFCSTTTKKLFVDNESMAISDVERYGEETDKGVLYQRFKEKKIGSIIFIPIKTESNDDLAILEIASPRPYELNSINKSKLIDIVEVFQSAVERFSDEFKNVIEATIQEHYTAIHPTVKWRFYDAVTSCLKESPTHDKHELGGELEEIIFKDVYPLFGQSDITGSSIARNNAIQKDLSKQLNLAIEVIHAASEETELPIYQELEFRVEQYLNKVKTGLNAGDEIGILDFLRQDIYPVFNHLKTQSPKVAKWVSVYMDHIDPELHVVYDQRKDYENSVSLLNEKLAAFIDERQDEAQAMFPHYFERYKTDGVEYNMYIGQSLVKKQTFDDVYLYNLRLWQLQLMCEMENVANLARNEMDHDLQVASLILVHSNPLAIKFRMDEKKFDVDGAYNIRYEIIKKRIDKAHIKGTNDRLTVPGKIAIVYSQDKDAREYLKYITFLQSKNLLGKMERLEIEDLQGVTGLKALRVEVIYQDDFDPSKKIDMNELINGIEI